jgi:hypothetical protein
VGDISDSPVEQCTTARRCRNMLRFADRGLCYDTTSFLSKIGATSQILLGLALEVGIVRNSSESHGIDNFYNYE